MFGKVNPSYQVNVQLRVRLASVERRQRTVHRDGGTGGPSFLSATQNNKVLESPVSFF